MADNGKLQFFGQIVYPQTLSTNILNPDGTPAPVLPIPSPANVGKVPVVNATGNGYELQAQGSGGGITQSTVVAREATLPTATADSPDFVEVGGVLYRKKAIEGSSLLGTWVFNDTIPFLRYNSTYNISFNSYNQNFTSMTFEYGGDPRQGTEYSIIKYGAAEVARGDNGADILFGLSEHKTFEITDVSSLSDEAEFESLITTIATKTGGGAPVTYEYVAQQDIPTPTAADNGKVLGVANGAYALQETSGGGSAKRYCHNIRLDLNNNSVYFSVTDYNSAEYSSLSDVVPIANTAYISGCITEKGKSPDFSSFVYQMIELDNKSDGGAVYAYYLDSTGTRKYVSGNNNDIASDLVFELGS